MHSASVTPMSLNCRQKPHYHLSICVFLLPLLCLSHPISFLPSYSHGLERDWNPIYSTIYLVCSLFHCLCTDPLFHSSASRLAHLMLKANLSIYLYICLSRQIWFSSYGLRGEKCRDACRSLCQSRHGKAVRLQYRISITIGKVCVLPLLKKMNRKHLS